MPESHELKDNQRRRLLDRLIIALAAGIGAAGILTVQPLLSANNRSRWCTVWSVVEARTYAIDTIIQRPEWDTIDKVRYQGHFYSSKPPLLPTLVAGLYWCIKRTIGWNLLDHTSEVTHLTLLIVNLAPMIVALALLARMLERYARTDTARYTVMLTAAAGTFLTTYLVTLNNHTVATFSLIFALYAALRIVADGQRKWHYFALAGFFAAFTCTNELPAALFGVTLFGLLAFKTPRSTLLFFVPAAVVPIAAFFATNYIATGTWKPMYMLWGTEAYEYVYQGKPSYWSNPSGIDANDEPWPVYLMHCTVGHRGIFSLSPIFLLAVFAWITLPKWRDRAVFPVLWMGLFLTVAILVFYLTRTENYNYGGRTTALRWTLWLIPFWLLSMVPVLDRWGGKSWLQWLVAVLLSVSAFSAFYAFGNPWQFPWLHVLMEKWGWIRY